jgi:hypothetical protein
MAQRPTWLHTSGGRGAFGVTGRGQRGHFPLAESLDRVACVQASTCGPAHPRPSHRARKAQGGAVCMGAEMGKSEGRRNRGWGWQAGPTSQWKVSLRKRPPVSWAAVSAGLGRRVWRKVGNRPKTKLKALEKVDKWFRFRVWIWILLKFKLHTNKIQINLEKPNSSVLPYFEYMFL